MTVRKKKATALAAVGVTALSAVASSGLVLAAPSGGNAEWHPVDYSGQFRGFPNKHDSSAGYDVMNIFTRGAAFVGGYENYRVNGRWAYCVQAGLPVTGNAGQVLPDIAGSAEDKELMAFASAKWGSKDNNDRDTQAAVGWLAHAKLDQGAGKISAETRRSQFQKALANAPQAVRDNVNAIQAEYQKWKASEGDVSAADKDVKLKMTQVPGEVDHYKLQVTAAEGATATVVLSGSDATFAKGGNETRKPAKSGTYDVWSNGKGTVSANIEAPLVKTAYSLHIYKDVNRGDGRGFQTMVYGTTDGVRPTGKTRTAPGPKTEPTPPTLHTTATDKADGDKDISSQSVQTITDAVAYTGLKPGTEYTLVAEPHYAPSGDPVLGTDGQPIQVTHTFTPKSSDGTENVEFQVPALFKETKIVAFETLKQGDKVIIAHTDINDVAQTVHVTPPPPPSGGTTATDASDGDKVLAAQKDVQIKDVVAYKNLLPGKKYTATATAMYKDGKGGTPVLGKDGKPVSKTVEFTPTAVNGNVEVVIDIPAQYVSHEIVIFEDVQKDGKTVFTHADINDKGQTVRIEVPPPNLHTTAVDKADGDKELPSTGGTITDRVEFKNLIPGKEYTFIASPVAVDSAGKPTPVLGKDGEPVKVPVKYTPTAVNGSVDIDIPVPALPSAEKVVMFEDVQLNGKSVAVHNDINDKDQTVNIPHIGTTATDAGDGDKFVKADGTAVVKDHVVYRNLIPGKEYTLTANAMDKATKKPVVGEDGKPVTSTVKFTPTAANGAVDIEVKLPKVKPGSDVVMFEKVANGEQVVTVHANINDEGQTVHIPSVHTTAWVVVKADGSVEKVKAPSDKPSDKTDGETADKTDGKTDGKTADKTDGKTTDESDSDEPLVEPGSRSGTVALMVAPAGKGGGDSEAEARGEVKPADESKADAPDLAPGDDLGTVKTEHYTEKQLAAEKPGTVGDHVVFERLIPGKEYTLEATVMDKATGKPVLGKDGKPIVVTKKFTPASADGFVDIEVDVPAQKQGTDLVMFERVLFNGNEVVVHTNINDEGQTVHVPKIGTTATDKVDGDHYVSQDGGPIIDRVAYHNLIPGKQYTVTGTAMVKGADGKPVALEGATSKPVTFTPTKSDGFVNVEIEVPAQKAPVTVVAFESLSTGGREVVVHENIEDKAQSVFISHMGTVAVDKADGDKTVLSNGSVKDTVKYENVAPGKYTASLVMMDKSSGKPAVDANGEVVQVVGVPVTLDKANGTFDVEVPLNGTKSTELVAFETLTDSNGHIVTYHRDLSSGAQTVSVVTPPKPPKPPTPPTPPRVELPKTGAELGLLSALGSALAGIGGGALLVGRKRRGSRA